MDTAAKSCPNCKSTYVGKIGTKRYFCANCCVEFTFNPEGYPVLYYADPTGTAVKRQTLKVKAG